MSVVLKYLEWLQTSPNETYLVYDLCPKMPVWNEKEQDYVCKRTKRIDAQRAKEIIRKEGLKCVCDNEYGRIYA